MIESSFSRDGEEMSVGNTFSRQEYPNCELENLQMHSDVILSGSEPESEPPVRGGRDAQGDLDRALSKQVFNTYLLPQISLKVKGMTDHWE